MGDSDLSDSETSESDEDLTKENKCGDGEEPKLSSSCPALPRLSRGESKGWGCLRNLMKNKTKNLSDNQDAARDPVNSAEEVMEESFSEVIQERRKSSDRILKRQESGRPRRQSREGVIRHKSSSMLNCQSSSDLSNVDANESVWVSKIIESLEDCNQGQSTSLLNYLDGKMMPSGTAQKNGWTDMSIQLRYQIKQKIREGLDTVAYEAGKLTSLWVSQAMEAQKRSQSELQELIDQRNQMQIDYLKEVSHLRIAAGKSDRVIEKAIEHVEANDSIEYYEPMKYVDPALRDVILSVVDVKVRSLFNYDAGCREKANQIELAKLESQTQKLKLDQLEETITRLQQELKDAEVRYAKQCQKLSRVEWELENTVSDKTSIQVMHERKLDQLRADLQEARKYIESMESANQQLKTHQAELERQVADIPLVGVVQVAEATDIETLVQERLAQERKRMTAVMIPAEPVQSLEKEVFAKKKTDCATQTDISGSEGVVEISKESTDDEDDTGLDLGMAFELERKEFEDQQELERKEFEDQLQAAQQVVEKSTAMAEKAMTNASHFSDQLARLEQEAAELREKLKMKDKESDELESLRTANSKLEEELRIQKTLAQSEKNKANTNAEIQLFPACTISSGTQTELIPEKLPSKPAKDPLSEQAEKNRLAMEQLHADLVHLRKELREVRSAKTALEAKLSLRQQQEQRESQDTARVAGSQANTFAKEKETLLSQKEALRTKAMTAKGVLDAIKHDNLMLQAILDEVIKRVLLIPNKLFVEWGKVLGTTVPVETKKVVKEVCRIDLKDIRKNLEDLDPDVQKQKLAGTRLAQDAKLRSMQKSVGKEVKETLRRELIEERETLAEEKGKQAEDGVDDKPATTATQPGFENRVHLPPLRELHAPVRINGFRIGFTDASTDPVIPVGPSQSNSGRPLYATAGTFSPRSNSSNSLAGTLSPLSPLSPQSNSSNPLVGMFSPPLSSPLFHRLKRSRMFSPPYSSRHLQPAGVGAASSPVVSAPSQSSSQSPSSPSPSSLLSRFRVTSMPQILR